ncbi:MAG: SDR family oxidoreductase [Lachnospiraceae bacterium]|nr:SDR family oxidoreductase [Lachnospiraceae bacterium]
MGYFTGKTVVVTGAREGVGRTIAVEYAKEGARLILVSRSEPKETAEEIQKVGGTFLGFVPCDISDEAQVIAMGKKVAELSDNCVDILVNNAGYNGKAHLIENMVTEDWRYTIDLNLTGTMMVCRELIPILNKEKANIVNMSSNVSKRGIPERSDYCCSKWAILGLTETLALELVDRNIRVNAVCPGPISGERAEQLIRMHAEAEGKTYEQVYAEWVNVPMKRFIDPEEIANVIKFLSSDMSSAMTGQALNITGGMLMN